MNLDVFFLVDNFHLGFVLEMKLTVVLVLNSFASARLVENLKTDDVEIFTHSKSLNTPWKQQASNKKNPTRIKKLKKKLRKKNKKIKKDKSHFPSKSDFQNDRFDKFTFQKFPFVLTLQLRRFHQENKVKIHKYSATSLCQK